MNQLLISEFQLSRRPGTDQYERAVSTQTQLILLILPRRGKGWALNSALAISSSEVVVTLDADTHLDPEALAELSRPFQDPLTAAVGGFIFVRNANKKLWITRHQYVEYLKNFLLRIGLAQARICLQVSGAFGAFRRRLLVQVGGFSTASLVEDYEIIYRFHEWLHRTKQDYRITIAPRALAYTDGPETVVDFIRQRTRWFAGFLQTFWDYRFMLFNPLYGRIAFFILPIKTIDAFLPIWGLGSLGILLSALGSGRVEWSTPALILFASKWLWDTALTGLVLGSSRWVFPQLRLTLTPSEIGLCVVREGLFFHWFRQAAVVNAYGWVIRRVRRWEQTRWTASSESTRGKVELPVGDVKASG